MKLNYYAESISIIMHSSFYFHESVFVLYIIMFYEAAMFYEAVMFTIWQKYLCIQVQVQSLLAKSAENMLLAIYKHKWIIIIMLWHIYIWRKKRNTTKEKSNAKTLLY